MAVKLSKDRYDSTEHGALISWGVIENSPDGVFMTRGGPRYLFWGAWKGFGNDWAIYVCPWMEPVYNIEDRLEKLHATGDKVHGKDLIARMIDADPEVLARYRR